MTSKTEGGRARGPALRIFIEELARDTEKGLGHEDIRTGLAERGVPISRMKDVSKRITDLVNDGTLLKGGQPPYTIYWWVPPEKRVPLDQDSPAERLVKLLDNPTLRAEAKAILEDRKRRRAGLALIAMMEKNQAAEERQAEKDAEVLEDLLQQRLRYWDAFHVALLRFDEKLSRYILEYEQLPQPMAHQARRIDDGIGDLRRHLQLLETKMFPGRTRGKGGLAGGSIIDARAQD